jgi:hypothetical protein
MGFPFPWNVFSDIIEELAGKIKESKLAIRDQLSANSNQ